MSGIILYDDKKSIQNMQKYIGETLYAVYSNFDRNINGLYLKGEPTIHEFVCTNISINDSYITFNENILCRYDPNIFEIHYDENQAHKRHIELLRRYYANE